MALDKLTKVQSVGISSFIQVVGVVTATGGFVGDLTGNVTGDLTGNVTGNITGTTSNASGATGDFSIADKIVHTGDTNTAIRFPAADTITAETNGSERLRILSGGEVYIGSNTSSGQGKLFVNDSSGITTTRVHIRNAVSTGNAEIYYNLDGTKFASVGLENGDLIFRNSTSSTPTERLRINASGSLIVPAGGNLQMASNGRIFVGNGGNAVNPMFANVSDTNTGIAFPAADTMMFTTGGSERLRMDSGGTVHVNSPDTASGGRIYAASSKLYLQSGNGRQSFNIADMAAGQSATHEFNSSGNLVLASGSGIDFSAAGNASGMTSELLDDYEEGNFTPIARGRTTAGTATYGRTAVGKYTKVGRMVSVMVDMVFSGSTGSGNIEIAGLPYAAHSGPYVRFAGDVTLLNAGISWSNQIACYINDTNSYFWITNTPTSGNYSFVNINSNTTEILLHCTYMVS